MTLLRRMLWLAVALAIVAMLSVFVFRGQPKESKFKSFDLTGADYGKALSLTGHDGKPRTLADFQGKLVVLTFGFTHCPDVCPTTLSDAAQAMKSLGRDAERVQVLFVTLDPARDGPAVLSNYVPAFDPRFLGLYGDAAATKRVADEFKIYYARRDGPGPGAYAIDHSAQSYVLDAQGRLRLLLKHDRLGADLADDLRTLLKEAA